MEEHMKEFFIPSDNIKLHAKLELPEFEDKCPLAIIFHGLTGHMEEEHIIAAANTFVEKGIAALRVELYGHGQSEGDFSKHNLFRWINNALDVISYVKTLDYVSDLYLCGHSQGGLLTIIVAGMKNDDFKAIIPMSPAINIVEGAKIGNFLGLEFDPVHIPDKVCFAEKELDGDYLRVAQMIDVDQLISRYKGKVLITHGDEDEAVPLAVSLEAAKKYSDCKLVTIKGDDHCYTRHLDEVVEAIRDFI